MLISMNNGHNLPELQELPIFEGEESIRQDAARDPKTVDLLRSIFCLFETAGDWKAPLKGREVLVAEKHLYAAEDLIRVAVERYTSTPATIMRKRRPSRGPGVILQVFADGYRNGPAGP